MDGHAKYIWAEEGLSKSNLTKPPNAEVKECLYSSMNECRREAVKCLPGRPSKADILALLFLMKTFLTKIF